jgi:NAD(P)-dependent dehydrogenase (short-subunit alcohol dehydrogenase family)
MLFAGTEDSSRPFAEDLARQDRSVHGYKSLLREDPERYQEISSRIPQGRWGEPDDLKGAAVFLASRASDYVNGHTLVVDGGWCAR